MDTNEKIKRILGRQVIGSRVQVYVKSFLHLFLKLMDEILNLGGLGMTPAEILADFDYLTPEDIQACLACAADRVHHQLAVNA